MKNLLIITILEFVSIISYSQILDINTGVTVTLNDITPSETSTFWLCGDGGTLMRSTNNGINWISFNGHGIPSSVNLISICTLYPAVRMMACGNSSSGAHAFLTNDNGNTWSEVFFQPNGSALSVSCQIFVGNPVGGRWSLWKYSFFGQSWDSSGLYLPQMNNEVAVPGSILNTGDCDWQFYIGTNTGKIYRKIGNNWIIYSSLPENNIRTFDWEGGIGYIAGSKLYYTSNAGVLWNEVPAPGSGNYVNFIKTWNSSWYVREDNKIYNLDSTGSWILRYTSPNGNFTRMKFTGNYLFALRNNGSLSRISLPSPPVGIGTLTNDIPDKFSLSQNYPNPFNPVTKIKFDISGSSVAKTFLYVYDVLGHEIAILVNQQLQPGSYETEWEASAYPSGVYYYKLETGSFTETKKMVLIK